MSNYLAGKKAPLLEIIRTQCSAPRSTLPATTNLFDWDALRRLDALRRAA
jgi:hypothetical protein